MPKSENAKVEELLSYSPKEVFAMFMQELGHHVTSLEGWAELLLTEKLTQEVRDEMAMRIKERSREMKAALNLGKYYLDNYAAKGNPDTQG